LSIASITNHRVVHSFPVVIHAQVKAKVGAIASLDGFNPRLPGRFDSLVQQTKNFAIIKRLFRHRKNCMKQEDSTYGETFQFKIIGEKRNRRGWVVGVAATVIFCGFGWGHPQARFLPNWPPRGNLFRL
jgi:hypothetical protein